MSLAGNKNNLQNISNPSRGSAAVLTSSARLAKTNFKKIKGEREIRGNRRPKYGRRRRDKCFT
jgi:hypothetical protein